MSSELIERLNDEAMRLHGRSIDRGCVDSSLSGSLALEAAAELEANAAEIGRLREALKLALTKAPHQSRCARLLPTSEWSKEKGNYDYSDCSCERHQIITALNKQESGNV